MMKHGIYRLTFCSLKLDVVVTEKRCNDLAPNDSSHVGNVPCGPDTKAYANHTQDWSAQNDSSNVGNVPCGPDTKCKKRRRSDDNKHKYKICPLWTPPQW
eukprot:106014_1